MSRVLRPTIALGAAAIMGLALSACSSMPFNNRTQSTELAVGQCLLVPLNSQVNSVATTECTEAHTGEVYSVTTLKNDTMPSRDEMDELVYNTCSRDFVGPTSAPPPRKPRWTTPQCRQPSRPGPRATARSSASPCAPTTSS